MNDAAGNPTFAWWAKTCDKPKVNIPVLGKDEYYLGSSLPDLKPGEIIDFQPITMTFIDPLEPSMANSIIKQLSKASGESFPRINGAELKKAFGEVQISQIDSKGFTSDRFLLKGAFPSSIDFGSLDYGSDDFVTITMTWEYTAFQYLNTRGGNIVKINPLSNGSVPTTTKEVIKLDGQYT